jgi:two-component system NtrC family sensor kinase
MESKEEDRSETKIRNGFYLKFGMFNKSVYGRVVLIITIMSVILFVSFGVIFRSVYEQYLNTVILQNGNNVGSLVEGALYNSMLGNDKDALQNTLDIIHTLPGIEDVTMYDIQDSLVYTSLPSDSLLLMHADCKSCHPDLPQMFPRTEKSYKIITAESDCKMSSNSEGQRHLLIRSPILNERSCFENKCHAHSPDDEVLGSLIIKVPLKEMDEAVYKSSMEFYLLATSATILLIAFWIFFTRREIKLPLNELLLASHAVSNGDRKFRVTMKSNQLDDMRLVGNAFNEMLDNLQKAEIELLNWSQQLEYKVRKKTEELGAAQSELMHIERLASLGKLSSSVAHEINNPLSGILVYTKLVQKQLRNPELSEEKKETIQKHLKLIETETKRCGDIVKGLLDFSKKDQENFEPKHLHDILNETFELMSHPVKIANIKFMKDYTAKADLINCSPNQIKQACIGMIVNATEAVSENGEIILKTSNPDSDFIKLEIIDNGIGIDADVIPHIFEPFFSTKQEVRGIGLGLAISHGIIQSHNGKITVQSEQGVGTSMSVFLPIIRE